MIWGFAISWIAAMCLGAGPVSGAPDELAIRTGGHLTARRTVCSPPPGERLPAPVQVLLEGVGTATGLVVDASGEPVASADVRLIPAYRESAVLKAIAGGGSTRSRFPAAETGPDGVFALAGVATGEHALVVTRPGFAPRRIPVRIDPSAGSVSLSTVWLEPGRRIEGIVVDPDGVPIEGATVDTMLMSADGRAAAGSMERRVRTDLNGRFSVVDLPGSRDAQIRAARSGFVTSAPIAAVPDAEEELRIELAPAGGVSGSVLDAGRRPVSGARVSLRSADSGTSLIRLLAAGGRAADAVTGDDGRFELTGMAAGGAELRVVAECCLSWSRGVEIEAGRREEVEVRLDAGGDLRGTVLDARREPVAGAAVSGGGKTTRTDSAGRFRLRGLPDETRSVAASHRRHGRVDLELEEPAPPWLTLRSAEEGMIAGRVVASGGRPVPGARVIARCPDRVARSMATTDADGSFRFSSQPGECDLGVRAAGWLPAAESVRIDPGETIRVTIALTPGGSVSGRLLGVSAPDMEGAVVTARSVSGESGRGALSGAAGTYRIAGLVAGEWSVVARVADGRQALGRVDLDDGEAAVLDLELDAGRELRGRVTLDGRGLAGGWVEVASPTGSRLGRTVTGADGDFRVDGLSTRRVFVEVSTPEGDLGASREFDLEGGTDLRVELRTGRLAALARDARTGQPLAGATVIVEPLMDSRRGGHRLATGPDGWLGRVRVLEGRYRVTVSHPGHAAVETTVEVAPGSGEELILDLAPL